MHVTTTRHAWRLGLLALALMGSLACGDTSCDCVQPLQGPMPEQARMYDALQLRLTPAAFGFIEQSLPDLLAGLMPNGLAFDVPPMHEEFDAWIFTIALDICEQGCTLVGDITDATLTRVAPDTLQLDALLDLTGTLTMTGDVDCDVPIHIQDKPLAADVHLLIDDRDGLMTFEVTGLDISIEDQDFSLDCAGLLGAVIEALKGVITDLMNDQIGGQLDDALGGMLADATCLKCDFYAGGCPAGSTCDADGAYCLDDGDATCRSNPLGLVGTLDLGALLADFAPGLEADLDLELAVGQAQPAAADPLVVDDGLNLRMIGGADAAPNLCVPPPPAEEVPSNAPPARLPLADTVPGTADPFMAGIGISDAFLDWFMYKAYLSGLLCISLDTEATGGLLSSGTLAALLGSLNRLTGGRNAPVRMALRPQHVPEIEIGAGTFTVDAQGNKIIDEPLIAIFLPETALDFYVLIDDRWVRVVSLTQDLTLLLGMEFLPDNRVLPVFDENSIVIENVVATDYELLAEQPEALEEVVPTLLGLALPMLTGSLGVIELPELSGFVLDLVKVQPELPRADSPYFDYLGLYANLSLAAAPAPASRSTRAKIVKVATPVRSRMSIFAPGQPVIPQVEIEVAADGPRPAEYSWRLDGGAWSVFRPGPRLSVQSPVLLLEGEHRLEVRARTVGDYRSLDPQPIELAVRIDPEDDGVSYEPPRTVAAMARPGLAPADQALVLETEAEQEPSRVGCSTTGGHGWLFAFIALVGLWGLGRRRRA